MICWIGERFQDFNQREIIFSSKQIQKLFAHYL